MSVVSAWSIVVEAAELLLMARAMLRGVPEARGLLRLLTVIEEASLVMVRVRVLAAVSTEGVPGEAVVALLSW